MRTFGKEVDILLLPACFREDLPLPEGILLALRGFAGKIRSSDTPWWPGERSYSLAPLLPWNDGTLPCLWKERSLDVNRGQ